MQEGEEEGFCCVVVGNKVDLAKGVGIGKKGENRNDSQTGSSRQDTEGGVVGEDEALGFLEVLVPRTASEAKQDLPSGPLHVDGDEDSRRVEYREDEEELVEEGEREDMTSSQLTERVPVPIPPSLLMPIPPNTIAIPPRNGSSTSPSSNECAKPYINGEQPSTHQPFSSSNLPLTEPPPHLILPSPPWSPPILGRRSGRSKSHTHSRNSSRGSSQFYGGTLTSTHTGLTIYHTPSSSSASVFDVYASARTSPEPHGNTRTRGVPDSWRMSAELGSTDISSVCSECPTSTGSEDEAGREGESSLRSEAAQSGASNDSEESDLRPATRRSGRAAAVAQKQNGSPAGKSVEIEAIPAANALQPQHRARRTTSPSRASTSSGSGSGSTPTITPSMFARGNGQGETPSLRYGDETFVFPNPNNVDAYGRSTVEPLETRPKLFFTSAKTGEGVADVFEYIARRVVRRWEWEEAAAVAGEVEASDTIRLEDSGWGEEGANRYVNGHRRGRKGGTTGGSTGRRWNGMGGCCS